MKERRKNETSSMESKTTNIVLFQTPHVQDDHCRACRVREQLVRAACRGRSVARARRGRESSQKERRR